MKNRGVFILSLLLLIGAESFSRDPNFYIYLCFGQSNMQGTAPIEVQDKTANNRFKVFQALDCPNLGRMAENWYAAVPPTCQCYSKLSPADYFGKTMVANLPDSISVGIINVSVAGCDIRLFDKDIYLDYDSTSTEAWFQNLVNAYGGNPYEYLMGLARLAGEDGVIKGILLHQGETNTGDQLWPSYVKKIYDDMLTDLSLDPESTPLLAGELVDAEQGGCCSSMNPIINRLPETIPNAHVISSAGCPVQSDRSHFTSEGYRILGRRYAEKMLSLLGYESVYLEAECGTVGDSCAILADDHASNEIYVTGYPGLADNITQAPADNTKVIQWDFTAGMNTTYTFYGRFNNPDSLKNTFWIKIDDGEFEMVEDLATNGWQWLSMKSYELTAGAHSLSIGFGEYGTLFDKIAIKNSTITPEGIEDETTVVCTPEITNVGIDRYLSEGSALEQNFPNPFSEGTSFVFNIQKPGYVSLIVYNMYGAELVELAGKKFHAGEHSITYHFNNLSPGNYFYTLKTDVCVI
ncbi:MAG: sialate O-acetylesterase, partial [Bacteroidales bacterium]